MITTLDQINQAIGILQQVAAGLPPNPVPVPPPAPAPTKFSIKLAPLVWSGSTSAFGFPINNGWSTWLSATKLAALKAKGFDGLRMSFELGVVMGQTGAAQAASITSYVNCVKSLVAAGLQVIVVGNADTGAFTGTNVFDGVTGPHWTSLKAVMVSVAQQLASLPGNVAFELPCNEPRPGLTQAAFAPYALDIWKAVRAVAPNSVILIAGDNLQSPDWLMGCPLTMFPDANTWATFHYYGEPHGQQGMQDGYHNWYHRIPVPVPADLNTRLAELQTQLANYNATLKAAGIDPATKTGQISNIHWYYGDNSPWSTVNAPRDQANLNGYFASIKKWAGSVPVMLTEGGITGDNNLVTPPSLGADRQSCINGRIMLRTACAANGFPLGVQQLFGVDGKQGQGILTNDANFTFDDAIVDAIVNGNGWVAR